MSDTRADEATKTYTHVQDDISPCCEAYEAVREELTFLKGSIAELERREALLTANVVACERRRSYHPPKPPMSMNDAEVRAWSLDEMAIDLAMVDTYTALTEAGFPW